MRKSREVVIVAFKQAANYLPSNIGYFSMIRVGESGYTEADFKKQVSDLVVVDGHAFVVVSEVESQHYRDVRTQTSPR